MWLILVLAAALCPAPSRNKYVIFQFEKSVHCNPECATYIKVGKKFQLYQPCGACQVNHHCPLACGGVDDSSNLEWLTSIENLKRGADCSFCKEEFFECGSRH